MEHKNKFVKSLCIAAFLSILCLPQINSKAMAQAHVPTLDRLNQEDATIPDTDPPQVYPESAYTLTEIENADPENLPQNAITLYDKNDDGTVTPKYYTISLKQTEFGDKENYGEKLYFKWEKTDNKYSLVEANESDADITYYVNNTRPDSNRITTNQNGADITANFKNLGGSNKGGAIYNNGTIGDITGDFIGNCVSSTNNKYGADGGAIDNSETIGNITGDFIGNYASGSSSTKGGAIYNDIGTIGNITGDFIGNYASGRYSAYGGAIHNGYGTIGNITGDFIGNYASSPDSDASGGAIYNNHYTEIGNITGDFIGNYASASGSYSGANGGAISNFGANTTIGNITGDFIGNYASSTNSYAQGGAIYNYIADGSTIIGDITGDFIGNYASSTNSHVQGGAIYNKGANVTIGNITGDFIGNYASSTNSYAQGGAIYNDFGATIGDITGDFIGNYAQGNSFGRGGAIYNSWGTIGAKDDDGNVVGGIINSSFINNYAKSETDEAKGGAIYTEESLNIIAQNGGQSVFSGNYVQDKNGKRQEAIYVENNNSAGSTTPEIISFEDNKLVVQIKSSYFDSYDPVDLTLNANTNGVIRFDDQISGEMGAVNATYQMNIIGMAQDFSGKDDMYAALGLSDDATVSEVVDACFDYIVEQEFGDEGLPPEYAGQIDLIKGQMLVQLIDMGAVETSDPELISSGSIGSYNLKITGDSTGKVILNNDIINANISLDNTNLYLGREDVFDKSVSLSLNSGSIYLNNQSVGTMHIPTLNLNGNTNISVDADLANKSMDRITADTLLSHILLSGNMMYLTRKILKTT